MGQVGLIQDAQVEAIVVQQDPGGVNYPRVPRNSPGTPGARTKCRLAFPGGRHFVQIGKDTGLDGPIGCRAHQFGQVGIAVISALVR